MKYTKVFKVSTHKPIHKGVYQVREVGLKYFYYAYWNGKYFTLTANTPKEALWHKYEKSYTIYNYPHVWRGLTTEGGK